MQLYPYKPYVSFTGLLHPVSFQQIAIFQTFYFCYLRVCLDACCTNPVKLIAVFLKNLMFVLFLIA